MLSYEEALKILHTHIKPYERVEKIILTECLGRILAVDIVAKDNYPKHLTASMDGYAVKFSEQNNTLKVLGITKAGSMPEFKLNTNECVKTFTGSLMCEGSDTLVPVENVELNGNLLKIKEVVKEGFAVRKIAESYKGGEILLKKGTKLDYSELGLLAELGIIHVSVFVKPIIGILSSGDELKDLGECVENEAQLRSSNHIALANLAKKLSCQARIYELLKDDKNLVKDAILNALQSCDILITTGGVSMGDFDFLKEFMQEYNPIINKVSIKPGRHIKIVKINEKFIIALPGFPYSSMVMFNLFVREILNVWFLQKKDYFFKAFLRGKYKKKSKYLEFVAVNLNFEDGKIYVNLKDKKEGSSAILNNLNNKAALMCISKEFTSDNELVDIVLMP
ncbi:MULTISPECIES: molybdopterin molybdotransferase MoeA [unclassified Campylobacter]|uniref:molybdopterin molybdotransferase MoeA n=1 Tax=unclassified Campylobacter TaxID=2593542 RepID=UPI001237EF7E|nr:MULTISPECIES: molybdopterin molybdotransferase MoeA [unclassified Campylobacter]KAA6226466.1 molybdopterin molybdotransferase MoeA [Campylobacter sp. LR185c]KAA6228602.1 molybdopterin molybdotransferase MoeA [Campylobacter sp. LR196d]KAA6229155.1 molybdopterin molybdotransferase MoeA [Campylobacter sp. LR286c]KAA8603478.1 molybdopterin molybdenumtransferase MoeA [Campylobacter sp. LR185c]